MIPTLPLDRPAKVSLLHEWRQQGLLSETHFATLMARLRGVEVWRRWAARCFMILGTVLLLCGIVFFFAWNWQAMARWQRLGLAGLGFVLPALASRLLGPEKLAGKLSLLAACVMIGVFIAVFGQEYQTGADTHGLFFGWALLALPWVIAACFEPLWIVWLVLMSTGLTLYWKTEFSDSPWPWLFASVAGIHALALAAKECLAKAGVRWLRARWSRLWLGLITLGALTFPACVFVLDFRYTNERALAPVALIWLVVTAGMFAVYRYRLRDAAAMSLSVLSASIVLMVTVARWLYKMLTSLGDSGAIVFGFLLYTTVIGTLMGACVWLLRKLARQMEAEAPGLDADGETTTAPAHEGEEPPLTWGRALQAIPSEVAAPISAQLNVLATKPRDPMWLQLVSAIGGWMAAWAFLPMLFFVVGIVARDDSGGALMTMGVILLPSCTALNRALPKTIFLQQMNLAIALGAVGLIHGGYLTGAHHDSQLDQLALMQLVIAGVTYPFFNNAAYRFLISLWAAVLIVIALEVSREGGSGHLHLCIIVMTALTTAIWAWRTRPAALNPLAYALALSLAGTVQFQVVLRDFAWHRISDSPVPAAFVVAAGLITLVAVLNRGLRSLTSPWMLGLAVIIVPLVFTGEMGVLTAMLLTAAAFAWGDKLLGTFAWVFLASFLFFFYYGMTVPLSMKSLIIGGSGIAFLIIRFVLLRLPQSSSPRSLS